MGSHRTPSLLGRIRDLLSRAWLKSTERMVACRACSDADKGACNCLADCGHINCTAGFDAGGQK